MDNDNHATDAGTTKPGDIIDQPVQEHAAEAWRHDDASERVEQVAVATIPGPVPGQSEDSWRSETATRIGQEHHTGAEAARAPVLNAEPDQVAVITHAAEGGDPDARKAMKLSEDTPEQKEGREGVTFPTTENRDEIFQAGDTLYFDHKNNRVTKEPPAPEEHDPLVGSISLYGEGRDESEDLHQDDTYARPVNTHAEAQHAATMIPRPQVPRDHIHVLDYIDARFRALFGLKEP